VLIALLWIERTVGEDLRTCGDLCAVRSGTSTSMRDQFHP
jgi:hypothetical protein